MTPQTTDPSRESDEGEPDAENRTGHGALAAGILWAIGALAFSWLMNNVIGTPPLQREMMRAQVLIWEQRYDEAIQAFTVMIERSPTWSWPYGHRGEAYRQKGDLDRALTDLNEAIRLKPDFEEALFSRCQVWRRKGDAGRAMPDCTEAARLKPDDWPRHQIIAELLLANGEFERAYEKFGEVIHLKGGATPHLYRGLIALFRFDRPAEAAEEFAKAAKEAFDYRLVGEMLGSQVVDGVRVTDLMAYRHPFVPDGIYLLIWTHMARTRAGQDDFKELQEHAKQLASPIQKKLMFEKFENVSDEAGRKSREPWPGPIFALFLDHTTPAAVRTAAEAVTDADVRKRRLCDANFYIAELYLEKKRRTDEARTLLQAAADECPASARERAFAKAELKRLGW
jgi:tetratricopeptide (TPR) repeat protein